MRAPLGCSYHVPNYISANDISRGSYAITKVRVSLAGAHGIMTAAAFMLAGMISARREGRSVSLRDTINPADMSILAGVMGVTQEVCPCLFHSG